MCASRTIAMFMQVRCVFVSSSVRLSVVLMICVIVINNHTDRVIFECKLIP